MVGTWTYTVATNILTVTGGTAVAPCGFIDAWNADKAGTLELLAATGAALNLSLARAVRPTDEKALKLDLVITDFVGAGNITLTGIDKDGGAQSEVIAIAGNGTSTTTLWYASIDAAGVDCTGTYTIQITQGQWGVVSKYQTEGYMIENTRLQIGDGSTSTYFTDTKKNIYFYFAAGASTSIILVKAAAVATFGVLNDATDHDTTDGCNFILNRPWGQDTLLCNESNATLYLYSCSINCVNALLNVAGTYTAATTYTIRVWNCVLSGLSAIQQINSHADIYNVTICKSAVQSGITSFNASVIDRVTVLSTQYYLCNTGLSDNTISNIIGRNCVTAAIRQESPNILYLINPDFDVWTFSFAGAGRVYRQYTFDLKVTDKDGVAINGATVTVNDRLGNLVFTENTAADGTITQHTVTRGYYITATGNTLQESSPHNLTITKAGYETYDQDFTLDEVTDWEIALLDEVPLPVLTGDANPSDVFTGKTFYKDDATRKLTGTMLTRRGGSVVIKKEVKSELEEPLLMLTGVLLTEKLKQPKPSS